MVSSPITLAHPGLRRPGRRIPQVAKSVPTPSRVARNFAALSAAEIGCRATSVAVTLSLTHRLGADGYGRVEFAFNIVVWLVLLVREGFDMLGAREIARHPRLIRPLVNHLLPLRVLLATGLFVGLVTASGFTLSNPTDRAILSLYGLLLLTTALGLDFVFRGLEQMGLVAISLVIRTAGYAAGALAMVSGPGRIVWVPICLASGEAIGISLIWIAYVRQFGWPRPVLSHGRFASVLFQRGRPVYLLQVSQAVLGSIDLVVVGLMCRWVDVGLYSAPHRLVTVVLTLGVIFQQAIFPGLARSWREHPETNRRALDPLVRVLVLALVPIAVGASILARPLVAWLFAPEFAPAALVLAVGVWRAPLFTLGFLYQTARIALNREPLAARPFVIAAVAAGPLVALLGWAGGLVGSAAATLIIGIGLVATGYRRLTIEGRAPAWHHHLGRPLGAVAVMVPACLLLARVHVMLGVVGGAGVYVLTLIALGGLKRDDLRMLLGRN